MKITTWLRCAALSLALTIPAGAASAADVKWTLTPIAFPDGGQISGSFVYDADTNTYSSINIVTTTGTALAGATYVRIDPANGFTPLATRLSPRTTGTGAGQPIVAFSFPALTNAGGTRSAVVAEGSCVDACFDFTNDRVVSGLQINGVLVPAPGPAPVPVPTLSEWAMILFGTVLAGGAALYVQRRRLIA